MRNEVRTKSQEPRCEELTFEVFYTLEGLASVDARDLKREDLIQ